LGGGRSTNLRTRQGRAKKIKHKKKSCVYKGGSKGEEESIKRNNRNGGGERGWCLKTFRDRKGVPVVGSLKRGKRSGDFIHAEIEEEKGGGHIDDRSLNFGGGRGGDRLPKQATRLEKREERSVQGRVP